MGDKLETSYEVTQADTNVLRVNFPRIVPGWEQWFLLRSDAHHDNPDCLQKLEKQHLDEALEKGAGIIDIGDLHCAMQGKYDKRSDKSKLRPEYQSGSYLDLLVERAADFYQPYAKNWLCMGMGNHETSIMERHETNLTQRLSAVLNDRTRSQIKTLGYTGWIWFTFSLYTIRSSQILWYTHGYGGGGPVTEDMIQSNRQRVYVENADIMLSGHVHRSWIQEFTRLKLSNHGTLERRDGYYVKLPTYKDAYGLGIGGFEVEKGHGPRPIGAYWLHFYCRTKKNGIQTRIFKA